MISHPEAQPDALTAADCERVFTDKASGKLAREGSYGLATLTLRGGFLGNSPVDIDQGRDRS